MNFIPGINDILGLPKSFLDLLCDGNIECVRKLLQEGNANPNDSIIMSDREGGILWEGYGALHFAIQYCKNDLVDMINLLIEFGADVNQTQYHGETPLGYAVDAGNYDAVKCLLEKGAVVNNRQLHTPIDSAVMMGHLEILKLLLEHNHNPIHIPELIEKAKWKGHQEVVEFLQSM